jgi:RNA polymerase sigma factor (sigma-70 family)
MSLSNGETEENHNCVTPWNVYYQKAQAGDIKAEHCIYAAADPFIERLSRVPYFRDRLGKDEIRSICYFALVKWVRKKQKLPPDSEVPFLLKDVLRKALLYCIRQQDARAEHEQPAAYKDFTSEEDETIKSPIERAATDSTEEPESKCLHNAFRTAVRNAVEQLPKEEKEMIHALYFQHKSMKEIAQELDCTCQFAYLMRHNAFIHLQKLLGNCVIS